MRKVAKDCLCTIFDPTEACSSKLPFHRSAVNSHAGKIVIIDPGHGGIDPGAKSKTGILEKT